jgi:hypothetical protein
LLIFSVEAKLSNDNKDVEIEMENFEIGGYVLVKEGQG